MAVETPRISGGFVIPLDGKGDRPTKWLAHIVAAYESDRLIGIFDTLDGARAATAGKNYGTDFVMIRPGRIVASFTEIPYGWVE
jgi:hypothetical protein